MVEFLSFRDGEAAQEPAVTVESFTGQSNSTAVRIDDINVPLWDLAGGFSHVFSPDAVSPTRAHGHRPISGRRPHSG